MVSQALPTSQAVETPAATVDPAAPVAPAEPVAVAAAPPPAPPAPPALLEAESLRVQFGPLVAVHDVTVSLRPGHLLGLIGPNGAGKTTFLRAAAGLQPLISGRVRVLGETLTPGSPIMAAVGFTPDTPPLYDDMTVRTFLRFVAKGYGLGAREVDERIGYWLERVWLSEKADQKIKGLSRGMRQRVGIARTLLPNPAVVLLDEPAAGLDPAGRVQFRKLLVELRAQGKALVVSSHILSDMADYCTHIAIMGKGTLLRVGTVGEIAAGGAAGDGDGGVTIGRYDVTLAHAAPGAAETIGSIPGVGAVTARDTSGLNGADGGATAYVVEFPPGAEHAARLLAEMVRRNLPVAAFAPEPVDLEQAYLRAGIRQVE